MTLIAAWNEDGTAYLVGDCLLTTSNLERKNAKIPTIDNLDEIFPSGEEKFVSPIVGLTEKLVLVSDNFVVGVAGNRWSGRVIVGELIERFWDKEPTFQDVKAHLLNRSDEAEPDCTLVGWTLENLKPIGFKWDSNFPNEIEVGDQFIVGSGREYMEEIFTPDKTVGKRSPPRPALLRTCHLLGYEAINGMNIWDSFGAGFVILYSEGGSFHYLPSATFIFLTADEITDELHPSHRIVRYWRESGCTFSAPAALDSSTSRFVKREVLVAKPLLGDAPASIETNCSVTTESEFYCIFVDLSLREGFYSHIPILAQNTPEVTSVRFVVDRAGEVEVLVDESIRTVVNEVLQQTSRDPAEIRKPKKMTRETPKDFIKGWLCPFEGDSSNDSD